jgi:hypothetical protein
VYFCFFMVSMVFAILCRGAREPPTSSIHAQTTLIKKSIFLARFFFRMGGLASCIRPTNRRYFLCDSRLAVCFKEWTIFAMQLKNQKLLEQLDAQDRRVVALVSEMDAQQQTFERAAGIVARTRAERATVKSICPICFDEDDGNRIYCEQGHAVCVTCVERRIDHLLAENATVRPLVCFGRHACGAPLADTFRAHNGETYAREVVFEMSKARMVEMMHPLWNKHPFDVFGIQLQRMRFDGTFFAYQCPMCSYGPIDHSRCDDLTEAQHHLGADNRCPRCRHLSEDVHLLKRWDGTYHS